MPIITGAHERRGRIRVQVDGEFWAELDAGVATERGLREGATFSVEELAEVRIAGERPLAMNKALNILGYRARSRGEINERLHRVGYAEGTVDVVVERLEEMGYIDDEGFARELVRAEARKYGPRRIYGDLRRAGVDEEIAREIIEEAFTEGSESEAAREAARRRYNTGGGSGAQARRVHGFLMRRGYSADICAEVARDYRGEAD
ncbi:MAG: RecX [uncultured Rubrobacteraceae bacterium]|uniref:Regulatory protein RecX n=1 Tax=uncultured Rubrobacteraceae bacterium TaxID=349277 RepID=A0A6J4QYQ0_9ACTN|nr:MAG: RecX [uncultured Rubrobacteraceae bacterium]